jgi:hypothetical protein
MRPKFLIKGWCCWRTPSTFKQKYIEHFRKISVTSKKYRNIPERISGAANKYRIPAGIFGFITVV